MAIKRGTRSGKGGKHRHAKENQSGYQRIGSSYFPSDAPVWWSYTLGFATGGSKKNLGMIRVAGTAWKKLTGDRMIGVINAWENPEVLRNIQMLAQTARQAELAFLNKYGIGNPGDDWSELIRTFNLLFSSERAFEQALKLIEQSTYRHPQGKDNTYHSFVTHFGSNLQTAARAIIRSKVTAQMPINNFSILLDEIIELALNKTFEQRVYKDSNGYLHTNTGTKEQRAQMEEIQAYTDFKAYIQQFMNNDFFKVSIAKIVGLDDAFLADTYKNMKNRKKLPQLVDVYRNGNAKGTIAEAIEAVVDQAVGNSLHGQTSSGDLTLDWEAFWSGGSGVKADVMMHNIEYKKQLVNIDELMDQGGDDNSKRANTIKAYRKWFEMMKDAEGDIVFVSDKNYQLNSKFSGFTAQGNTSLRNLLSMLDEIGMEKSDELIDFLANCGPDMLLGNQQDSVLDAVAAQIGHFLFDDLSFTGSTNINRIHLLNLSGIYLPLSVYLEGLANAVMEAQAQIKSFVSVSFKPGPGAEAAASPWESKDDWREFRDMRLDHSIIHVKFMSNFAKFITSKVKI